MNFPYSSTNKRYHSLDYYYKQKYQKKIVRLILDIGATCPTKNSGGCYFCSYVANTNPLPLKLQYQKQRQAITAKRKNAGVIAYFQQGSNTYNNKEQLQAALMFAQNTDAVATIIATRPDCIDEQLLKELTTYPKEIYIELGLQTCNDQLASSFNRGYNFNVFLTALYLLKKYHFNVTVHLISGLPNQTPQMMIEDAIILGKLPIDMIKIHYLVIPKNSRYGQLNIEPSLTMEQFVNISINQLRYLPKNIVIARLTTDIDDLIVPSFKKITVLNNIDKEMAKNDYYQGDLLIEYENLLTAKLHLCNKFIHAIDATAGNGKDSAVLAKKFNKVTSLDIQPLAIKRCQKNLSDFDNIELILDNFINIPKYVTNDTSLIVFNLGFLPGSNHQITTEKYSAAAIGAAYFSLDQGIILITVYTRHQNGYQELISIKDHLAKNNIAYQLIDGYQTYIIIKKLTNNCQF